MWRTCIKIMIRKCKHVAINPTTSILNFSAYTLLLCHSVLLVNEGMYRRNGRWMELWSQKNNTQPHFCSRNVRNELPLVDNIHQLSVCLQVFVLCSTSLERSPKIFSSRHTHTTLSGEGKKRMILLPKMQPYFIWAEISSRPTFKVDYKLSLKSITQASSFNSTRALF